MTNKEIARKLDISPAALSLVLNNKPGVSATTRKRVVAKIEEMGYSHLIKKSAQQSTNICFVVYKRHGEILDQHPFFLLLMESVESQARKYGFSILLMTIDNRYPIEPQIAHLDGMDARGAIIFATEMLEEDLPFFDKLHMPFVALDNDFTRFNINTVSINNQMGTYQAIQHLVGLGHKRIGYLKCSTRISSFVEREKGFRDALSHFDLELETQFVFVARYTEEGSYQDFKAHLKENREIPTAFVTDDDTIASGVMKALRESGVSIPDDISIIGFNDRPNCEISTPPLSSINVPRHSFGAEAIDSLMRLIEKKEKAEANDRSKKTRIGTQLVVRGSTSPIAMASNNRNA